MFSGCRIATHVLRLLVGFIAMLQLSSALPEPQCASLLAASLFSTDSRAHAEQKATVGSFVQRNGNQLLLNGQPFRFAGANMHWLALNDQTLYPSQFQVNDALDTAVEMGLTVVRSHDLGISVGCPNCLEPTLGVFNDAALQQ